MANNEDNAGQGGQGGQPQGGQPQGGQPQGGQPQGGQPGQQAQGGQPQGGQPGQPAQGGQPGQPAQGQPGQAPGQPAGQQAGYGEPGLADKLQQPAVIDQFKSSIGLYALIGLGFLLAAALGGLTSGSGFNLGAAFGAVFVGIGIGPLIAVLESRKIVENLQVEDQVLFVSTFIANAAGYLAMAFLTLIGGAIGFGGSFSFGDNLLPAIIIAIAVGVTGIVTVLYEQNV